MDGRMSFLPHIEAIQIISKSLRMLGFIKRISRKFRLEVLLKVLRCSPTVELLSLRETFWLAGSIVRTLFSCYDLRMSLTQGSVTRGY
jgi:hypothetical protein